MNEAYSAPPSPPIHTPKPLALATACLGKTSEGVVNKFVIQAWCAPVSNPKRTTAPQPVAVTTITPNTGMESAHASMVVLRALPTCHPRFMRALDARPPRMDPTPEIV